MFAAEPALANPVAFCIDTKGRIYVAESFRLQRGVTDNREHKDWIDQELACRTVADRVKMYERKFAKEIDKWKSEHERIRVLEDTNGDGVADRSEVFADGFKELADGIGAGLTCTNQFVLDSDGYRFIYHGGHGVLVVPTPAASVEEWIEQHGWECGMPASTQETAEAIAGLRRSHEESVVAAAEKVGLTLSHEGEIG